MEKKKQQDNQEFSAGAVVYYQDRKTGEVEYLLLHYAKAGHWDLPKGHIEKGESYFATIRREVHEETGIKKLTIHEDFKARSRYFFRAYKEHPAAKKKEGDERPWVFKMVTFYLSQAYTKKVKLSDEHSGFAWLPYKKAVRLLTYKNSKNILRKANAHLVEKHKKEQ